MTKTDALAGLQQLLAIRDGTAPPAPIQELLALDLVGVTGGRAAFRYWPDAPHRNPLGTVHGGVAMTLLDSAAGAAVHSTQSDGSGYTTLETNVNLVRDVRPTTGPLMAQGQSSTVAARSRPLRAGGSPKTERCTRTRLDLPDPARVRARASLQRRRRLCASRKVNTLRCLCVPTTLIFATRPWL